MHCGEKAAEIIHVVPGSRTCSGVKTHILLHVCKVAAVWCEFFLSAVFRLKSENIMSGEAAEVNTERLRAANKEAYSFIMVLMNRIRPYVLI